MSRIFLVLTLFLFLNPTGLIAATPKDHISDSNNWDEVGFLSCQSIGTGLLNFETSAFIGNGENISKVGIIMSNGLTSGAPNPTTNWIDDHDFEIRFYQDSNELVNTPLAPSGFVVFDNPTNPNYDTPVGTFTDSASNVFNLYYFEFDLSSAGIITTSGIEHQIAVNPQVVDYNQGETGITLCSYSNGGSGAIGSELDWFFNNIGTTSVGQLASYSWAPYDHMAYRIELEDPAPTCCYPWRKIKYYCKRRGLSWPVCKPMILSAMPPNCSIQPTCP